MINIILLQNAEKLLMKRAGQRGVGRPPAHCVINVEIIPSEEDEVNFNFKFKINLF